MQALRSPWPLGTETKTLLLEPSGDIPALGGICASTVARGGDNSVGRMAGATSCGCLPKSQSSSWGSVSRDGGEPKPKPFPALYLIASSLAHVDGCAPTYMVPLPFNIYTDVCVCVYIYIIFIFFMYVINIYTHTSVYMLKGICICCRDGRICSTSAKHHGDLFF